MGDASEEVWLPTGTLVGVAAEVPVVVVGASGLGCVAVGAVACWSLLMGGADGSGPSSAS